MNKLPLNYLFHLDFFKKNFDTEHALCLDYGCGDGKLVKYAIDHNYKFRGIDNYYDSANISQFLLSPVKEHIDIADNTGKLPYKDKTFDFICSEQVFEHVKDLENTLNELNRILKDNGKMVHAFPLKYCIIEGHFGIPFFHWFKAGSKIRKNLTYLFYKLGYGYHKKKGLSFDIWYKEASRFIDNFCYYRTNHEIKRIGVKTKFLLLKREKDKAIFHLKRKTGSIYKWLHALISILPDKVISLLFQIRGSVIIEFSKLEK